MEGTLCPKCSKPVEKDARVCLSCGNQMQGGGGAVKFSPPDSKNVSKESSSGIFQKKGKPTGPKKIKQPSFISKMFSFCFLLFTLGIAYAYLFDIQKILVLPNTLLQYGQVKAAAGILSLMKQAVLSKDKSLIAFRSAQMELLSINQNKASSANKEMSFKDFNGKWTGKKFLLDFTLENLRPFSASVSPSHFFIRISPNHYMMAIPGNRNRSKMTVQSWKSAQMSVLFSGAPFWKSASEIKATLIFNDGKAYFSRDIVLPEKVSSL